MEELLEEIKQKFNLEKIRIIDIIYNKNNQTLFLTFLSDTNLDQSVKEQIIAICKKRLIDKIVVKFSKNVIDDFVILHFIKDFLMKNYKTFATLFDFNNIKIEISQGDLQRPYVIFSLTKELFEIFTSTCKTPLVKYLNEQFFAEFIIKEQIVEDKVNADEFLFARLKKVYTEPQIEEKDTIIFNDVCDLIGSNKAKVAKPIKDIKGEMEGINVCGTISFFKERTFKKDRKGVEVEKKFYTFTLNDGTGKIGVTIFATVANTPKLQKLADQIKILIYGNVEIYNDRLSLRVKSLAIIGDYKLKKAEIKYKAVPSEYKLITPKKYEKFTQINWLEEEKKKEEVVIDDYFMEHDVVVFDLETTGLNALNETIIEIGAVRLVKGKIVDYFSTFINPQKKLDEKIVKLTGITDLELSTAPLIHEVMGDFYKYCYNTVLIAYNSDFDIGFLQNEAKKCGYYFDNKVIDAMKIPFKANLQVHNYTLAAVLAKVGIVNQGAHRAYNDAEATAELCLKFGKYLKEL